MLLWFAGMSVLVVWQVFRDPAFDYRLVVLGGLVPDLAGRYGHSLPAVVAVLGVVLLLHRRRWVALPIGMLLHLVLDGMWAKAGVFWWPVPVGSSSWNGVPSFDRPIGLLAAQEVAGALALVWWARQRRQAAAC